MKKIDIDTFISHYGIIYYDPTSCPDGFKWRYYNSKDVTTDDYKKRLKNYLGISKINGTNYYAEEEISKLLSEKVFNECSLAWKSGKVDWENGELKTVNFDKGDHYINGYGGEIEKDEFKKYCEHLEENKDFINDRVNKGEWKDAYSKAKDNAPKNFGTVNIINALFFITGGNAPIYDKFAHKAVKALLLEISPKDVYYRDIPSKDEKEVDSVIAMYTEYMLLLKIVFKDFFENKKKGDAFIPRELDMALWVYGHSQKELYEFQI